jgi:HEAT repeat protein
MAELGWTSADALHVLQDASEPRERREQAATVLGDLGDTDVIPALIDTLAEGEEFLSWACAHALIAVGSRRHGRRLIRIASGGKSVDARQGAIYAIWLIGEQRGEDTLIHIGADLQNQCEQTRLMAVEALGNTNLRRRSQEALLRHLFDPAEGVKYSALCALSHLRPLPEFIRAALREKLNDPGRVYEDGDIAALANEILS